MASPPYFWLFLRRAGADLACKQDAFVKPKFAFPLRPAIAVQ